jgi:transcriptional regulator with GAF, ATPase, and Fis domain
VSEKVQFSNSAVVDLAGARVQIRSKAAKVSNFSRTKHLQEINLLLDKGHSVEARTQLATLISAARNDPETLAGARLALSLALEMHGDYRMSLQTIAMYESHEARTQLHPDLALRLRVQIGLVYNYCGDHPKAIALLTAALRDLPEGNNNGNKGAVYAALARVYRSINEYTIARDYSHQVLESYRQSGDWRGLAEAYFGIALSDHGEGQHESALENLGQALKLIGDHPATFLLGKIYSNMASACWWLKRPQQGIGYIEKAIAYYEHTEHRNLAADGHNNLALNLILIGQWDRAHEALEQALAIATDVDERGDKVPMILDSMGELLMLRGDLQGAKGYLERAVDLATENGNKWNACQALRTLARCGLAMNSSAAALATAKRALDFAERIGDRHSVWESKLLLAESHLQDGQLDVCAANLQEVAEQSSDSSAEMGLTGETQRLYGLLALARSDATQAAQHFGRCISIFELLGDRYRSGRAHHDLGRAYTKAQPELAAEHLSRAVNIFRELGAKLDLAATEAALSANDQTAPQQQRQREATIQLVTLRLAEAVASRALLLRELAAVIRQETEARRVVILEPDEDGRQRVVIAHGCDQTEAAALADEFSSADSEATRELLAKKCDATVIMLRSSTALPATLLISPRNSGQLSEGIALDSLLRVVELGMDLCALRERVRTGQGTEAVGGLAAVSLMPGFIHSSPAMTRLVEEVHKIRSSDVTVMVTGESGTGKELVARAIHALSSRRQKVFVPFNCTAVPKELSESYLFGHRRGAFTGAVSDAPGVIRTAEGGTLFIDEVGDLPLDVQPKLLRFLQEGEIQPLGERQPIKVDVRIIAATNTDLEELVAQGRFREDLYYRLNVIRLRVPPLRERRSEIPTIVNYYVNHYSAKFGRHDIQITPQTVDLLMVADWPGNVRQLCNEIQRIVARAENSAVITPEHLSPEISRVSLPAIPVPTRTALGSTIGPSVTVPLQNVTLAEALSEVESRMISEALRKHNGNISRAARELGLTRRGLYLKLDRYKINASA